MCIVYVAFFAVSFMIPSTAALLSLAKNRVAPQSIATQLLASVSVDDPSPSDDLDKWGRFYKLNENGALVGGEGMKSEVRVVTFDLDNTIWKTGVVIKSANDALSNFLELKGVVSEHRVEIVMVDIFQKNKSKYCPVIAEDLKITDQCDEDFWDGVKAPVLLTQLRKDAIVEILRNQKKEFVEDIEEFSKEAFQVWTDARHAAIPLNFASSVLEVLGKIRELRSKDGKRIVVGAVTDGNSNPMKIEELKEYFDFVVNAESVGVSKPDKRIYDAAILRISSDPKLNHVFTSVDKSDIGNPTVQNFRWWVHIGDDFVKDIVATNVLSFRSIWCRELIMDKFPKKGNNPSQKTDLASFSRAVAIEKVLKMSIGTNDYLTESLQNEFADSIVDEFKHVAEVITAWNEE